MRKNVAFLSCTAGVLSWLFLAGTATATGSKWGGCSSFNPTVEVLAGPCPVGSAQPVACEASGPYTGIKYRITGGPDHVATVVTANNNVVSVPGNQFYGACVGDPVTGLGKGSCHERAVKVNPDAYTGEFWLVVDKARAAVLQSVVAKKGSCVKPFAIAGLGHEVNPFVQTQKNETVNFKGCAVTFVYDALTGSVLSAALDPDLSSKPVCAANQNDGTCCAFNGGEDVANLELFLNGQPLGAGQVGSGYVSTGSNSCTTRIIGGRVYTWGSPCPE